MLSFFRRVSKIQDRHRRSWRPILVAILAGFAVADISNFGSGNDRARRNGQRRPSRSVGDQEVYRTRDERSDAAAPAGRPPAKSGGGLCQHRRRFRRDPRRADRPERADRIRATNIGFPLSKPLVDAEIAQLPQAKGLNGKVSDQAYQAFLAQQRLTDAAGAGDHRRRAAAAAPADAGREQCAPVRGHGDALRVDDARIARRAKRSPSRSTRSRLGSSRPTRRSSNSMPPTATAT